MSARGWAGLAITLVGLSSTSGTAHAQRPNPDFPEAHRCYKSPGLPLCKVLTRIKTPDWSKPEDLIILPHRGYWGFGPVAETPENSEPAYANVTGYGYESSEVDFMPSLDGVVMSHDYVLTRIADVGLSDDRRIFETSSDTLLELRLRDRFGQVTDSRITSLQSTFEVFGESTVVFADIKQPPTDGDREGFARNWVAVLARILERTPPDHLYQVVVKTPYTWTFIEAQPLTTLLGSSRSRRLFATMSA